MKLRCAPPHPPHLVFALLYPQVIIHKEPSSAFCLSRLPIVGYHIWSYDPCVVIFVQREAKILHSFMNTQHHLLKKYFSTLNYLSAWQISISHRLCVYSLIQYSIDLSIYLYGFKILNYCYCFAESSDEDNNEINNSFIFQYF